MIKLTFSSKKHNIFFTCLVILKSVNRKKKTIHGIEKRGSKNIVINVETQVFLN